MYFLPAILFFAFLIVLLFLKEEHRFMEKLKKYVVRIVLLLVLSNGLINAFLSPYWSPIDEGSHFAYIQFLVEQKRLPLLSDYSSREVLSIGNHTYPDPPKIDPPDAGLAGNLYEAFQPPLYYIASIPFYLAGGSNFINKIYLLRIWGILQLGALVFIVFKIFENLKDFFPKKNYFFASIAALIVGFTPSMVVRSVIIGNAILPIIFVTLVLWQMSRFFKNNPEDFTPKDAALLGLFSGLALLSRFTVVFLIPLTPIFLFLVIRKNFIKNSAIYGIILASAIAPWIIFNKISYGTFTSNEQAKQLQMNVVNPTNRTFDIEYLKSARPFFWRGIWEPEETNWEAFGTLPWTARYLKLLPIINIFWAAGGAFMLLLAFYTAWKKKSYLLFWLWGILTFSIAGAVSQQVLGTIMSNWPILLGRYMHPVITSIALFFAFLAYMVYKLKYRIISKILVAAILFIPLLLHAEHIHQLEYSHNQFVEKIKTIKKETKKSKKSQKKESKKPDITSF